MGTDAFDDNNKRVYNKVIDPRKIVPICIEGE